MNLDHLLLLLLVVLCWNPQCHLLTVCVCWSSGVAYNCLAWIRPYVVPAWHWTYCGGSKWLFVTVSLCLWMNVLLVLLWKCDWGLNYCRAVLKFDADHLRLRRNLVGFTIFDLIGSIINSHEVVHHFYWVICLEWTVCYDWWVRALCLWLWVQCSRSLLCLVVLCLLLCDVLQVCLALTC
jgi:hypothetical protein